MISNYKHPLLCYYDYHVWLYYQWLFYRDCVLVTV